MVRGFPQGEIGMPVLFFATCGPLYHTHACTYTHIPTLDKWLVAEVSVIRIRVFINHLGACIPWSLNLYHENGHNPWPLGQMIQPLADTMSRHLQTPGTMKLGTCCNIQVQHFIGLKCAVYHMPTDLSQNYSDVTDTWWKRSLRHPRTLCPFLWMILKNDPRIVN